MRNLFIKMRNCLSYTLWDFAPKQEENAKELTAKNCGWRIAIKTTRELIFCYFSALQRHKKDHKCTFFCLSTEKVCSLNLSFIFFISENCKKFCSYKEFPFLTNFSKKNFDCCFCGKLSLANGINIAEIIEGRLLGVILQFNYFIHLLNFEWHIIEMNSKWASKHP